MRRNIPLQKTARVIRPVCGLLFALFSFCYLYGFQADLLALYQHTLAQGQTTYSPFFGALIITGVLWGLQALLSCVVKFPLRFYALTFFPSCLLLALLCSVHFEAFDGGATGFGPWGFVAAGGLWGVFAWLALNFPDVNSERLVWSSYLWPNLLVLTWLVLFVGMAGNSHERLHYELRAMRHLQEDEPDKVLQVGARSEASGRTLSVMRASALGRQGMMGERLFTYPQPYGLEGLLPTYSDTLFIYNLPERVFLSLGASPYPRQKACPMQFLQNLEAQSPVLPAVGDYLLCAYLLERDLAGFSEALPRYYALDSLPTHYREALALHHSFTLPADSLASDSLLSAFQSYRNAVASPVQVESACRRDFKGTYWLYYYFPTVVGNKE